MVFLFFGLNTFNNFLIFIFYLEYNVVGRRFAFHSSFNFDFFFNSRGLLKPTSNEKKKNFNKTGDFVVFCNKFIRRGLKKRTLLYASWGYNMLFNLIYKHFSLESCYVNFSIYKELSFYYYVNSSIWTKDNFLLFNVDGRYLIYRFLVTGFLLKKRRKKKIYDFNLFYIKPEFRRFNFFNLLLNILRCRKRVLFKGKLFNVMLNLMLNNSDKSIGVFKKQAYSVLIKKYSN